MTSFYSFLFSSSNDTDIRHPTPNPQNLSSEHDQEMSWTQTTDQPILMDFKYATLTFLYIFQKTVDCKLPLLRWCHHELISISKFYRRYYNLISKFQVGLKSFLRRGLSEPEFYGDLVYKLKKIVGSNNFSAQFIKIISHYKKIGYNLNVLQQTACLVVNPIMVGNFAFLFNCTPVGRTSDSMTVPT